MKKQITHPSFSRGDRAQAIMPIQGHFHVPDMADIRGCEPFPLPVHGIVRVQGPVNSDGTLCVSYKDKLKRRAKAIVPHDILVAVALIVLWASLSGFCPLYGNCTDPLSLPYPTDPPFTPLLPPTNPLSLSSPLNPLATDPPKIYDSNGVYRGEYSANPLRPDSTSNPVGRYGNPLSPDSLNQFQWTP